jgi:hypothetical protein
VGGPPTIAYGNLGRNIFHGPGAETVATFGTSSFGDITNLNTTKPTPLTTREHPPARGRVK